MKVILLEKILKLGDLWDQVLVKTGYARNFLFPKGKAVLANEKNIKYFMNRKKELAYKLKSSYLDAKQRVNEINKLGGSVTIKSRVSNNETGKLFGSVNEQDISKAMKNLGVNISKKEICLPDGVFNYTGSYNIIFQFHSKVFVNFSVIVVNKE
ncbi:MAG: 50S ribosomal subunit protein L9 [Candidatus Westeberhardia cardiocondylae]|nr:50S ribosomal subunit protein L9 [Candidatus Westeberhardia cardiocondylae]